MMFISFPPATPKQTSTLPQFTTIFRRPTGCHHGWTHDGFHGAVSPCICPAICSLQRLQRWCPRIHGCRISSRQSGRPTLPLSRRQVHAHLLEHWGHTVRSGHGAGSLAVAVVHYLGRSTAAAVDVVVVVGRTEAAVEDMGRSLGCLAKVLVNRCVGRLVRVQISQGRFILTSILADPVDC